MATAKASWPGAPDGAGDDTPLHLAARSGDVELAKVLLKAVGGAAASSELLKDKNKRGLTPLGEALLLPVSKRATAAAEATGTAVGKENGANTSAVSSSCSNISKEEVFSMADALFDASGSALQQQQLFSAEGSSGPRGWPLLHVLCAAGSAEGVEWLLLRFNKEGNKPSSSSASSFVNERSSEATGALTPLHAAAIGGSVKAAELLIAAGAKVSSVDGAGRTPAEAFEAAFAAATKAAAANAAANANTAAATAAPSASSCPPLPLATAEEAKKLRSLLESSSVPSSSSSSSSSSFSSAAAAKKNGAAPSSSSASSAATSSASVEAFSNDSNSNNADSFSFSFESPAATFKALPRAEQLAAAKKWSQLDSDDALEAATSTFSPAAFEQARLARGMRHARAIAQAVAALHDDEDFQEAAKLRRVREAVATVRQDPSSIARFQGDPKAMDVLVGLRKLQAVCAANGRHAVPFEELVVAAGERDSKKQEDEDRVAGLGRLHDDHVRAAAAAAAEDDPKEAAAAAERARAEARASEGPGAAGATGASGATSGAKPEPPTGLLARARAVLAAASAEAEAAEAAAAAAARGEDGGAGSGALSAASGGSPPFDWSAFWRSLSKAMAASLVRAAIAFVVLWMVMKATTPPPATVVVPPASASATTATEAEL